MLGEKNRYISLLKQKAGELSAVRDLTPGIWDSWNPLFELLAEENLAQPVIRDDAISEISNSCRNGALIFVDFDAVDFLTANIIGEILGGLEQRGLIPVPVVSISSNQQIRTAVNAFINNNNRARRAGVRLFFGDPGTNTAGNVNDLVNATGLDVEASHLFIDLEFINSDFLPTLTVAFPAIVAPLPYLADWNSVTPVGTGFPRILEIPGSSNAQIPRTEWELFNSVRGQLSNQVNRLDFGDYAVTNPELIDNFDPRTMQVSPKVIYTADASWIAYKGRSSRGRGFGETLAMCQALVQRPEFLGGNYSAGDLYIYNRAQNIATQGNSGTWKRVATNHHITFVANQVANTL